MINLPGRELINGFDVTVAGFGSGEIDNQVFYVTFSNFHGSFDKKDSIDSVQFF